MSMNKDYLRGYQAAQRGSDSALDRADDRNEPDTWYDGYMDYAAGRPKGHLLTCTDKDMHETCEW